METDLSGAEIACAAGQCEQAIGVLESAAPHRAGDLRLYYWLGLCYGGCCRSHTQVHPGMAEAYLQQALRLSTGNESGRAAVLEQLANIALAHPTVVRAEALRTAIDYERQAADLYHGVGKIFETARARFNLGNSLCELAEITGEDHWPEAISQYRRSLEIRTRERDPERHAALLENLGTAYRHLAAPRPVENIKKSILCYRRASVIYTRVRYPERNAALHNNLGNAYLALAEADDAAVVRHATRALHHFERALSIQSDPHSRGFGIAQYNRAQAYFRRSRYAAGDLGRAAACLRAASEAFEACSEARYLQLIRRQLETLTLPA